MQQYQEDFIQLAIEHQALSFGEYRLKSGRVSPYFFNAGKFQTGAALANLGRHYAAAIKAAKIKFDIVFGPAYKGIPLAAAAAISLADDHGLDIPYCFNRKEAKDHGEGGKVIGAPLNGRVLVIDDVITAGTAVREVISIISATGAETAGVIIGLNRQEKGQGELSAIEEIEQNYGVSVFSIINLDHIIDYLEKREGSQKTIAEKIRCYREAYGVG